MFILLLASHVFAGSVQKCNIPVYLQKSTIPDSHRELFIKQLDEAVKVWNSTGANVSLVLSGDVSYNWIPGAVVVKWSGDRGNVPESTANTYVRKLSTGQITRASLELMNDEPWCSSEDRTDCLDMKNALIHEFGHVLGLDHSNVEESVMKQGMWPGEPPQHKLHTTDVTNVLSLYPYNVRGCEGLEYGFMWSVLGTWDLADN